mgnify:CR=1 FL=1
MIKRLKKDKRGQNMSIGTLVGLALAVIVLIFVVLGFTRGWGYIFGKTDYLPSDLETHQEVCKQYADQKVKVSFCDYTEDKLTEGDVYINCKGVYDKVEKITGTGEISFEKDVVSCGADRIKNFCKGLSKSKRNDVMVYDDENNQENIECGDVEVIYFDKNTGCSKVSNLEKISVIDGKDTLFLTKAACDANPSP